MILGRALPVTRLLVTRCALFGGWGRVRWGRRYLCVTFWWCREWRGGLLFLRFRRLWCKSLAYLRRHNSFSSFLLRSNFSSRSSNLSWSHPIPHSTTAPASRTHIALAAYDTTGRTPFSTWWDSTNETFCRIVRRPVMVVTLLRADFTARDCSSIASGCSGSLCCCG